MDTSHNTYSRLLDKQMIKGFKQINEWHERRDNDDECRRGTKFEIEIALNPLQSVHSHVVPQVHVDEPAIFQSLHRKVRQRHVDDLAVEPLHQSGLQFVAEGKRLGVAVRRVVRFANYVRVDGILIMQIVPFGSTNEWTNKITINKEHGTFRTE